MQGLKRHFKALIFKVFWASKEDFYGYRLYSQKYPLGAFLIGAAKGLCILYSAALGKAASRLFQEINIFFIPQTSWLIPARVSTTRFRGPVPALHWQSFSWGREGG
ncbi:hypothetical protein EGJ50_25205 [Pseudomonas luteola]|nr:hypothetical protein EGJ50_25205 [Pseudomonas luteola]